MKKYLFTFLFILIVQTIAQAGKIEKKLAFGRRADCKGFALNCQPDGSQSFSAMIVYKEPNTESLHIQIKEEDLLHIPTLKMALYHQVVFELEEDWIIPEDVIKMLKMPPRCIIQKGQYKIVFQSGIYTIIFVLNF